MKGVIAAVVAVVAVCAGLIWLARPRDTGPDPKAWEQRASAAFKPLVGDVAMQVVAVLTDHWTDHGERLVKALRTANERAWKAPWSSPVAAK